MAKSTFKGAVSAVLFLFMLALLIIPDIRVFADGKEKFDSMRLIVGTGDRSITEDEAWISSYDGVHILQYKDAAACRAAYEYYSSFAEFVEADAGVTAANGDAEKDAKAGTVMTKDDNPLKELKEIQALTGYDIALIDTGADGADAAVSVTGGSAEDDNGHGTCMLSHIREHAPEAKVLSIKALDERGIGDISAVYAAIRYATECGVKIINLSLSAPATEELSVIELAVNDAAAKGIVVTGAAGNNGKDAAHYIPGRISSAVIAGAADASGARLGSSNYGESVDYNVKAKNTSEAAAIMSGWICANSLPVPSDVLNKGLIFETGYEQKGSSDTSAEAVIPEEILSLPYSELEDFKLNVLKGYEPVGGFTAAANTHTAAVFYEYQSLLNTTYWCVYEDGSGGVGYCIDRGVTGPNGNYYAQITGTMQEQLGYVMRHGFPLGGDWGLSAEEAQYLTQAAVTGVMYGGNFYGNIGTMPPVHDDYLWMTSRLGWSGQNFWIAEALYQSAVSNAGWTDSKYVAYWGNVQGLTLQRLITPVPWDPGYLQLGKVSADQTVTDGNPNYSLEGAIYGVYYDAACTQEAGRLVTGPEGISNQLTLEAGAYAVKELSPSAGFYINDEICFMEVISGELTYCWAGNCPNTAEVPVMGRMKLKKSTADAAITQGNSCYSLEGARYGVYKDAACTQSAGELVTGPDGESNILTLPLGKYYIRELSPSSGYIITSKTKSAHLTSAEVVTVQDAETPGYDARGLELIKLSASDYELQYPLAGAQFTIRFFDNTEGDISKAPLKTWIVETKEEDGTYRARLASEFLKEGSDGLYMHGEEAVLPVGTIHIAETKPAPGYTLKDMVITDDEGNTVSAEDGSYTGIIKADGSAGASLSYGNRYTVRNTPVEIYTIAENAADGSQYVTGEGSAVIRDTVLVGGAEENVSYRIRGELRTLDTGEKIAEAERRFTAGAENEHREIVEFRAEDMGRFAGRTLYVAEYLYKDGETEELVASEDERMNPEASEERKKSQRIYVLQPDTPPEKAAPPKTQDAQGVGIWAAAMAAAALTGFTTAGILKKRGKKKGR